MRSQYEKEVKVGERKSKMVLGICADPKAIIKLLWEERF